MFISGYANTENVFYCLNIGVISASTFGLNFHLITVNRQNWKKITINGQGYHPMRPSASGFIAQFLTYITGICFLQMSVSRIGEKLGSLSNDDGDVNENGKKKRFRLTKQQLCKFITLFCTFLCRHCTTTTWKYLISRLVEDLKTRQRLYFSFPELLYSLLDFNSKKHLPTFDELNEMEYTRAITFQTVDHRSTSNLVTFSQPSPSLWLTSLLIVVKPESFIFYSCFRIVELSKDLNLRSSLRG